MRKMSTSGNITAMIVLTIIVAGFLFMIVAAAGVNL